jgi:hypothetical protein
MATGLSQSRFSLLLMKLIYWRCFALLLSWAILGCGLMAINHTTAHLDPATFGAILIASASYLFGSTALLQPLTKNPK